MEILRKGYASRLSKDTAVTDIRSERMVRNLAYKVEDNPNRTLVTKAGVLPFRDREDGTREFLIAKPRATKNPKDAGKLPFALARGTVDAIDSMGRLHDLKDMTDTEIFEAFRKRPDWKFEEFKEAALREGHEELGLNPENITQLYDCGVLKYKDYGIHFFAARVRPELVYHLEAADSEKVMWVSEDDIARMHAHGVEDPARTFKAEYMPLFEAISKGVSAHEQRNKGIPFP